MKTVALFEGVERIGKTTLIKRLFAGQDYEYVASLKPIRHLIKANNSLGAKTLFGAISYLNSKIPETVDKSRSAIVAIDRWFVSEWVYQFSWVKRCFTPFLPVGIELFLMIGPNNRSFYVSSNTEQYATASCFNNKMFRLALEAYKSGGYKCTLLTHYPLKHGVQLYKIVNK